MAGSQPRELTPAERRQVDALLDMDEKSFRQDLLHYLRSPDPASRRVFRHPDLVERTHETATHIMIVAQQRQVAADSTQARAAAVAMEQYAAAELRATSSRVKALRSALAENTPQRWAERILGVVHRDQVGYLKELKSQHVGAKEAAQRLKDMLASEEGWAPFRRRDKADRLLGRLLKEQRDEIMRMLAEGKTPQEAVQVAEKSLARRYGGPDKPGEDHP